LIRLALFDIDGTLVRTGGAGVRAFGRAGELVFRVDDGARHLRFPGRTDASLLREFLDNHGIPETPETTTGFYDSYVFLLDHYLQQAEGRLCPGVEQFLDALEQHPTPPLLGLLTGNIRLGAEIKLRHFGLWHRFRLGAFGDDHEDRNVLAAVALRRARELLGDNLPPNEVLVVGDTVHDIACARAVGARVLAVATGGDSMTDLAAARPDWLLPDLTGADAAEICRSIYLG
jgi:phosphoglycolate phosphatase